MAKEEEVFIGIMADMNVKNVTVSDATAVLNSTDEIDKEFVICKNCLLKVNRQHHKHAKPLAVPPPRSPQDRFIYSAHFI